MTKQTNRHIPRSARRARLLCPALLALAPTALPAWVHATACTNGGITRNVEVVYSNPGQPVPCEVIYDKSGEGGGQQALWSASNEAGYCEARAAALVDRLTGFGWSCDSATPPGTSGAAEMAPREMLGESMDGALSPEGG